VLADFGLLSLALPLGWLAWVWRVRDPTLPSGAKIRAFAAGLGFVLALALLFGGAAARAWLVNDQMIEQKMADFFILGS
jgi:hypothetical protein